MEYNFNGRNVIIMKYYQYTVVVYEMKTWIDIFCGWLSVKWLIKDRKITSKHKL